MIGKLFVNMNKPNEQTIMGGRRQSQKVRETFIGKGIDKAE
jgi:hypothetical protein